MPWSLLIRGGTVIDGTGTPRRELDVAVEGETIAAIGPHLPLQADRVIEAGGHVVAPGFIDAHSHSDLFYMGCPSSESKIRQGCTTEVVGMCSFSPAPIAPGRAESVRDWARRCNSVCSSPVRGRTCSAIARASHFPSRGNARRNSHA